MLVLEVKKFKKKLFLKFGGKILTCLWKLHSTCPKEHFEKKNNFWKFWFFFKLFRILNEDSPCLAKKLFGRDIKFEKRSLRLRRSNKKSNFWKISFFSNSSEIWTNIYRAWPKSFGQGYQNWKLQSSSQKINQKIKLLKVLFIYQTLQNFERTITVLGEKVLGRDIKIENCTLCLQIIMLGIKFFFRKFCKFSFYSDLEHNCFGFEATEFSPSLSKIQSTCLYEFSLRCWYKKWNSVKGNLFLKIGGKILTSSLKLHSTSPTERFD